MVLREVSRRCNRCTLCRNPCGVRVPERGVFQEYFLPASASRCEGQQGDGEAEMPRRAPSSRCKGRAAMGERRLQ